MASLARINYGDTVQATIMESSRKEYDVFLNFRGEDTRRNIVDHLYWSLTEAQVKVYMDDPALPYGEEIERELLAAIEESKIAITIISEDYASSANCLKELSHILKCKGTRRLMVMPVFYKVKPSDLRNLRNSFERIQLHVIKHHGTTVEGWKEALKRIANMKGLIVDETSYEGNIVRSIVEKVKNELKSTCEMNINHLVGIGEKAREIMEVISKDNNDVFIVGIYGMDGIGKTTLATYIYNQLLHSFEFCSFVANAQETLSREVSMEQLISFILERGSVKSNSSNEGMTRIKQLFHKKKVLIVLDDIDSRIQMRILMRMCHYIGSGSKIILTTRNIGVVTAPEVTLKYELTKLNPAQSMELFCKHAFRRLNPVDAFRTYTNRVVEICGGLPLALEVIGSSLFGKEEVEWKCILKKLEDGPCKAVEKQLLLTYQVLDDKQKQMFLDIACCPDGLDKNSPFPTLEAADTKALDELEALSLVKVDNDNKLHMHDLLRDLARKILQVEGVADLLYHSQLLINQIRHMLKENKEVFTSTPLIEELPETTTTQLDQQGYFPRVQASSSKYDHITTLALEEQCLSQYEFGECSKTIKLEGGPSEVPLQFSRSTGATSIVGCNSMEAKTTLSQPIAHLDNLFCQINAVMAHRRCMVEEKLPDSTQEAIFFVDTLIKQISLPNAADITFSPNFLKALESLRQFNAFHEFPRELLKTFQNALTSFARTPEYLNRIQSARNAFSTCMQAKMSKFDELCNLVYELSLEGDALEQTQREIDVLETKLTSLKAKRRDLMSKLNNAILTLGALTDEFERCSDQLLKAKARFDDIQSHEKHINANHHRFLHLTHKIRNFLRRKTRNQVF